MEDRKIPISRIVEQFRKLHPTTFEGGIDHFIVYSRKLVDLRGEGFRVYLLLRVYTPNKAALAEGKLGHCLRPHHFEGLPKKGGGSLKSCL